MKTINCLQLTLAVWLVTWEPWCSAALRQGGPSPSSEFTAQPSNVTVPAGEQAVLKCKTAQRAHVCRWYYLEFGLDFFDDRVTPLLVKDFSPANHRDCSIRIKPVRKVQEGQWLCQALKFHSSKFLMTRPANLRVITEDDSASWPPPDTEDTAPRGGRREDGIYEQPQPLEFETTDEDPVVNTPLGEPVTLKCQVNQPIAFCSWIMPNGAVFYKPLDEDENKSDRQSASDYKINGDLMEGNCSLALRETRPQDEGNWRCVVKVTASAKEVRGPLIHLHMTEHHLPGQDGTALVDPADESLNFLVISLVIICTLLSIIVVLLFTCLYRRGKTPSEETRKILQISPRSSMEFNHKTLPVTDLTASSVMAVEPNKMRHHSYVDLQDYHQYLDMSKGSTTDTGYTRMSGSSVRSSTSSRTTLSTLSTLPVGGRCRSASNSTTLTDSSPNLTTVVDNPSYNADIIHVNRGIVLPRPASVYSNDHVYEEIKERKDDLQLLDKIVESSPVTPETPTYTNTTEDYQGYMIPKKSPSTEPLSSTPTVASKAKLPLPDLPALNSHLLPVRDTPAGAAPPYSRIGENGLVPEDTGMPSLLGPGYSRVGTVNQDPMAAYDVPRAIPTEVNERYDVPRRTDSEVSLQATTTMSPDNCGDGLVGTIV